MIIIFNSGHLGYQIGSVLGWLAAKFVIGLYYLVSVCSYLIVGLFVAALLLLLFKKTQVLFKKYSRISKVIATTTLIAYAYIGASYYSEQESLALRSIKVKEGVLKHLSKREIAQEKRAKKAERCKKNPNCSFNTYARLLKKVKG